MARYRFSRSDSIKGGKIRAAQAAVWRLENPTESERKVRSALADLGIDFVAEYPVETLDGTTQYFDIYIPSMRIAIEVDGSLRWHDPKYLTSKMAAYDHIKANWAYENNISLHRINVEELNGNLVNTLRGIIG